MTLLLKYIRLLSRTNKSSRLQHHSEPERVNPTVSEGQVREVRKWPWTRVSSKSGLCKVMSRMRTFHSNLLCLTSSSPSVWHSVQAPDISPGLFAPPDLTLLIESDLATPVFNYVSLNQGLLFCHFSAHSKALCCLSLIIPFQDFAVWAVLMFSCPM